MQKPSEFAERVVLGALLVAPETVRQVIGTLRVEDFRVPWHRHVFAILHEAVFVSDPGMSPSWRIAQELTLRLGHRRAHILGLHDLMAAVPPAPDVLRYTEMVLEESLRRQIAEATVLIRACGLGADLGAVASMTALIRACVAGIEQRWLVAEPAGPVTLPMTGDTSWAAIDPIADGWGSTRPGDDMQSLSPTNMRHLRLTADRLLTQSAVPDVLDVRDREVRFVSALVSRPSRIQPWAEHVRPESLRFSEWATVMRALQALAEAGQRVDVLTVAWEVDRAARQYGEGPALAELRAAVDASCYEDADHLGRLVCADRLRRVADGAAASLAAAADNRGLTVPDLVDTARVFLAAVERAAEPLEVGVVERISGTAAASSSAARAANVTAVEAAVSR